MAPSSPANCVSFFVDEEHLVSDVVRQVVAGKGFEFEDRGEVELKGFDQPVPLFEVHA
jgi:class 3 adenylate cyclase